MVNGKDFVNRNIIIRCIKFVPQINSHPVNRLTKSTAHSDANHKILVSSSFSVSLLFLVFTFIVTIIYFLFPYRNRMPLFYFTMCVCVYFILLLPFATNSNCYAIIIDFQCAMRAHVVLQFSDFDFDFILFFSLPTVLRFCLCRCTLLFFF